MITYLRLANILPYGFDLGEGGGIMYLGLAHIRPYGFDLDSLDGLGGGGFCFCVYSMVESDISTMFGCI